MLAYSLVPFICAAPPARTSVPALLRKGAYTVNEATQKTLDNFRRKAEDLGWAEHPYQKTKEKLRALGEEQWSPEHKEAAIAAIVFWAMSVMGGSVAVVLNEIMALVKIADEHGENEAVENMMTSMNFVEGVFRCFMSQIDFHEIATALFEDGEKMERERLEEEAAAEAAKAKVRAYAATKVGTMHRVVEPSQN